MKNKELIIGAIIIFVFVLLGKKRAFESLELKPAFPRNFRFVPLTNLSFEMPFIAFNGSSGTLNIGSIDFRIYAEGQQIGRAWTGQNQQILPNGQTYLYTQCLVSVLDLAAAVPGFLGGIQDQVVNLNMQGTINVEGFYVNVDIPVSFNIPKFK